MVFVPEKKCEEITAVCSPSSKTGLSHAALEKMGRDLNAIMLRPRGARYKTTNDYRVAHKDSCETFKEKKSVYSGII